MVGSSGNIEIPERTGGFFAGSDREQWDRTMGLITYGVLNCSRAVIEGMQERRWGRIVNVISDAGRVGEARDIGRIDG